MCLPSSPLSSEPSRGEALNAMSVPSSETQSPPPAVTAAPRPSRGVILALGLSAIVNVLLAVALVQTYRY
jgi:hypothetical protein